MAGALGKAARGIAIVGALGFGGIEGAPSASATSSVDELVEQARFHEAKQEDDLAIRRYTEALTLDPTCIPAWQGLGALRMKLGDPAEAERVFTAALVRVPDFAEALEARAHARWSLGQHEDAEADLERYAEMHPEGGAYRELAGWLAVDGRSPAQLAAWRHVLAWTDETRDPGGLREARRMVRALIVLVDGADPASSPPEPDATRRSLAHIARRAP